MRNLKRALSLALAAAMLVSLMVVGASAASYGDQDKVSQTEAVDVLTGLGIVGGDQNGNFNPTATLTRAEFCVMIANALTGGTFDRTLFEGTITPFTDVTGHWGEAYIAYCYANGIIAGTSATTFSPDATLTSAQAAAILLMALGYNQDNEFAANGQFELNVTRWAQQTGLYNDLSVSASAGISRENTAKLIFNSLTEAVPVSYSASFDIYYNANGSWTNGVQFAYDETLGFKNFDLVYKTVTDDLGQANTRWGVGSVAGNYLDAKGNLVSTAVTIADRDKIADVEDTPILTYTSDMTKADSIADIDRAIRGYDCDEGYTRTENGVSTTIPDGTALTGATLAPFTGDGYTVKVYANNSGVITSVAVIMEELAKVISVNTTQNEILLTTSRGTITIDEDHDLYADLAADVATDDYILAVVNATGTADLQAYAIPETVTGVVTNYTNKQALTVGGVQYKPSDCIVADTTGFAYYNAVTPSADYTDTTSTMVMYLDSNGYYLAIDSAAAVSGASIAYVAYAGKADDYANSYEAYVYLPDGTKGVYDILSYNSSTKLSELAKVTSNTLYVYELTDNGIRLKDAGDKTVGASNFTAVTGDNSVADTLKKNNAIYAVGTGAGINVVMNANTVFYVNDTSDTKPAIPAYGTKTVDQTDVNKTGYINTSTGLAAIRDGTVQADGTLTTVIYRTDASGNHIALAVLASYAGSVTAVSSDLVFISSANWTRNGDNYDVKATFTGETAEQTITIDSVPAVGLYSYRLGNNGVYTLESPENCAYVGQLSRVEDLLFVDNTTQMNNLDEALVFDATDNEAKLASVSMLSVAGQTPYGYVVVDNTTDMNVLAVYITSQDGTPPMTVINGNIAASNSELGAGKTLETDATLSQTVSVSGNEITVTNGFSLADTSKKVLGTAISAWGLPGDDDAAVVLRFDAPAGVTHPGTCTVAVEGGSSNVGNTDGKTSDGTAYMYMVLSYDTDTDTSKTINVTWNLTGGDTVTHTYKVDLPYAGT